MRRIVLGILMLFTPGLLFSQSESVKKFDHYAGVQVNQLLKEIINLNGSNSTVENPYLLSYSLLHNKLNLGLTLGFGYTFMTDEDHDNPEALKLEKNDISYFAGVFRRLMIGEKFELNYGLDYAFHYSDNKSFSFEVNDFGSVKDSTYFQVKDETKSWGGGLDVTFRYYLSKHVLIGTQLYYFMMKSENKSNSLTYTHTENGSNVFDSIESSNEGSDGKEFELQLPVAIFLTFKF